jgi:hypothetical protein
MFIQLYVQSHLLFRHSAALILLLGSYSSIGNKNYSIYLASLIVYPKS